MFGTIRKHQTWLWAIIIVVVVISFVIYFNPSTQFSDRAPTADFGVIGGERITVEKLRDAQKEVMLHHLIRYGDWPESNARDSGFDVERETYYRLLLLHKVREMEIRVGRPVVARMAGDILRSLGGGNPVPLDVFVSRKLSERSLNSEDFERFIQNEVAVQELVALVGGSGRLVTPDEVRVAYTRQNEELSAQIVAFLAVNYLQDVNVTTQAVAQFYTNQMPRYRLPERVEVSYVAFNVSNYLAEAEGELAKTNLSEIVDANFQRLGTNYVRFGETEEKAKAKIREEIIRSEALSKARRVANEFATVLFDREPLKADNLDALAKERGLEVRVTEPFDREEGPKDLDGGPNFAETGFKLSADSPFSAPLVGQDAVYVLAYKRHLPSEVPPFESLVARVTGDCRYENAVALARQAGRNFRNTLTNGLAEGKSFSELCTAAKLKPVLLPPCSLSTRSLPEVEQDLSLAQFKQVAFDTAVGTASDLVYTRDGGVIVHVKSRLPLDETKMKEELPRFTAYVRQMRQNDAFNEWFRKQAEDDPGFRIIQQELERRNRPSALTPSS